MRTYRRVLLAATATVLAMVGSSSTGVAAPDPDADPTPQHYVALGDSYAAGPLIPVQRTDPPGCNRSTNNYPALLARELRISHYTDVTCSGAKTDNMTTAQNVLLGTNPPQFDALRPDTDLVTLTISGNDVGFTEIIFTCGRAGLTDPAGNPCERQATSQSNRGGQDFYAQRIAGVAPKVGRVLEGIHERSPRAKVLLVGYLRILPPTQGCYPIVPIARGDVPYLDGLERQLTDVLTAEANDHDALFVDSYANSLGHDSCQPPATKWVEGTVPTSPAAPVHPNARGMQEVAGFALDELNAQPIRVG
ncbi:MAG: SGNH/GDSL hydrolase family protein [Pseudonocardiaceae bacterium]